MRSIVLLRVARLLTLLLLLLPLSLSAQDNFGGGTGDWRDPYIISTTAHLDSLSARVFRGESYAGKHFSLVNDLDFKGATFQPIGAVSASFTDSPYHPFSGSFHGNGHAIRNVVVNRTEGAAIFGELYGSVDGLTVGGDSRFYGLRSMGAIAGLLRNGSISNCTVESSVTLTIGLSDGLSGAVSVGGIVGVTKYCTVSRCINAATIDLNGQPGANGIGGIVGSTSERGHIYDCFNFGPITNVTSSARYVGNIVGSWHQTDNSFKSNVNDNYYGANTAGRRGGIGNENDNQATDQEYNTHPAYTLKYTNDVKHQVLFGGKTDNIGEPTGEPLITFNNTLYYKGGTEMRLKLWCDKDVTEGYIGRSTFATYSVPLTDQGDSIYTLTLDNDCDIRLKTHNVVRDIDYHPWISIAIPSVEYTGEPVTPAVTVTDTKDGTARVLTEGTDYSVVPLAEPYVKTGHYTVTIQGIGNYGNTATATLHITSPAGTWIGDGTAEAPYCISSVEDMDLLATNVNNGINYTGVYFQLTEDLDYEGLTYTPVGNASNAFNGNFNGNNHSLSNIVVESDNNNVGIFGYAETAASISNLTLADSSSIKGVTAVGGIVGYCKGNISNCHTTAGVSIRGFQSVGGIVGWLNNASATVSQCTNNANIGSTGRTMMADNEHGGIVGTVSAGTVQACINHGEMNGGTYKGGGIAGASYGKILQCVNTGKVFCHQSSGGIAGAAFDGEVTGNLNLGVVECDLNLKGSILGEMVEANVKDNLYYGSADAYGGIKNADVSGKAQRAYKISAAGDSITISRIYGTDGIEYGRAWYLGERQRIGIQYDYEPPVGYLLDYFTHNGNNVGRKTSATISATGDIVVGVVLRSPKEVVIDGGLGREEGKYVSTFFEAAEHLYVPQGVEARTYTVSDEALRVSRTYQAGDIIPAGEAVVLFADEAKTYRFGLSEVAKEGLIIFGQDPKDANSMLKGIDGGGTDNEEGYLYYILSYLKTDQYPTGDPASALGFYWQVEGGTSVTTAEGKAYLKVPVSQAAGSKGFDFNGTTTGIATLDVNGSDNSSRDGWYTLSGQRLPQQPTKAGIYIRNGRKVVVR